MEEIEDVVIEWKNSDKDNEDYHLVEVAGTFSNWQHLSMVKHHNGVWKIK